MDSTSRLGPTRSGCAVTWIVVAWICVVSIVFGGALVGCAGTTTDEIPSTVTADGVTSDGATMDGATTDDRPVDTTVPPTTIDPGTLPQTDDKPLSTGDAVDAMGVALWDAIVDDDPSSAVWTFFPLTAYEQVKDIWNPESDWNNRLIAAFDEDVAALHVQLGSSARDAVYIGIDIPGSQAQWIDPGGEYNKIGYWRVYGTTLRYEIDGVEKSLAVSSLISWRGEWYVVHLGPIR